MEKLKKLASSIWFWVAVIFSVLIALLGSEKAKRKLAELNLLKSDLDGKLNLSKERVQNAQEKIDQEKQNQKISKPEAKDLNTKETEDFWNKR